MSVLSHLTSILYYFKWVLEQFGTRGAFFHLIYYEPSMFLMQRTFHHVYQQFSYKKRSIQLLTGKWVPTLNYNTILSSSPNEVNQIYYIVVRPKNQTHIDSYLPFK